MSLTYRIRPARDEDLATIINFNAQLAMETEHRVLEPARLRHGVEAVLLDADKGRYFLAVEDERIAGQLMLTTEWSDWRNGRFWWIQSVYVDQRDRGKGVFRLLFDHVRGLADAAPDVCGLRLYFENNNLRARDVYVGVGMKMAGYEIMEVDFGQPG